MFHVESYEIQTRLLEHRQRSRIAEHVYPRPDLKFASLHTGSKGIRFQACTAFPTLRFTYEVRVYGIRCQSEFVLYGQEARDAVKQAFRIKTVHLNVVIERPILPEFHISNTERQQSVWSVVKCPGDFRS